MNWIEIIFWFSFIIIFYTFLGYGILLYCLVMIKRKISPSKTTGNIFFEPPVTLIIPAFNEADVLQSKMINSRSLGYPAEKLTIIVITDGSNDNSKETLQAWPGVKVLHQDMRLGKTAAENRAMKFVETPFVIFSDANSMLNADAIKNIVKHFLKDKVGCVSGEKKIFNNTADSASASGEGIYWKYESLLKKLDAELNSAVGAAGELVAFRTSLYRELPEDTLLDDFMQSMLMASTGYKIEYEPGAFALEMASTNVKEELKRKVRICAGGWQAIVRLSGRLRFSKTPLLFFQYVSHRVLRWTITPFLLIVMFILNIVLAGYGNAFYWGALIAQSIFYLAAIVGSIVENKKLRFKPVFIPYYFCVMNYAVIAGLYNYIMGRQGVNWEKSVRK